MGMNSEQKNYSNSEKLIIGFRALIGQPVSEISAETGMNRSYVYDQKHKAEAYVEDIDQDPPEYPIIVLTPVMEKRLILSMALDCASSIEGIQRALESSLGIKVSTGYISGVINEAAHRAQRMDDTISLEGIRQGANDEIFQCGAPILTGIDPVSSYTYLLEEAKDRTAETWQLYMEDCKSRGLALETTINDGGAGLVAGIPKAFPEITVQADTFHALYGMGKQISKAERKAEASVKAEAELEKRVQGLRPQQKTIEKLEKIKPETNELTNIYDTLSILFDWLKLLLGFSGYSIPDALGLITFVLDEMQKVSAKFPGIIKEAEKIRNCLPSLLSFISRLERAFESCAELNGIPTAAFQAMYRQLAYSEQSNEYFETEYALWDMLKDNYDFARLLFAQQLKSVKKASSLVENLNGRIRKYMDVKRVVPTRFFVLMKVYFNMRRYRRSRCHERIGKSPMELFTGKSHSDFLDALGYC